MAGDGWDEELDVEFQLPKGGTQRVAVHTLFLNSPNLIRSLLPQNGKNEDALEHPETFPREFLAIYCNSSPWPSVKQRRILMSSVVTRLVDHLCTDYDGVCAGAEDSLRLPNQIRNDATGRDFPWPYRSSCGGLTRKAENFWNSAPCSTKAPAGYCLQFANLCGAGRGYP